MTHTFRLPRARTWFLSALFLSLGCGDSGHSLGQLTDSGAGADGGAQDVAPGSGGTVGTGGNSPGTGGVGTGGSSGASGGGSGGGSGAGGRGGTLGSGGTGGGGKGGGTGGKGGNGGLAGAGGRGTGGVGGRGGAGGAIECSSLPLRECPSGQICDYNMPNRCGAGSVTGTCIPTPGGGCTADFNPVCGCNGTTYSNDCARVNARVQLDHVGACNDSSSSGGAGGGGGAGGSTICTQISTQYQDAITAAKMCSLASGHSPCQLDVPVIVGCTCPAYVDDDTTLKSLAAQWTSNGCTRVCPIGCIRVQPGNCVTSGTAATGTCQ